jgi:hypothetical protein
VRHLPRQRTAAGRAQPHRWREPSDEKGMGGRGVAVGARMGQRQKYSQLTEPVLHPAWK